MKTITIKVPDDCEVQIVKKEVDEKPIIRTYQDLISSEVRINGFYLDDTFDNDVKILEVNDTPVTFHCKDVAATEKVAKSMLAMAMISQLMPYYGGEITNEEWKNDDTKHTIFMINSQVMCGITYSDNMFLAFHTAEQRDDFLKYNRKLVEDYLMI